MSSNPSSPKLLLTAGEAGHIFAVCGETVNEFARRGKLRVAARTRRGMPLFDPVDVERLAEERHQRRLGPKPHYGAGWPGRESETPGALQ